MMWYVRLLVLAVGVLLLLRGGFPPLLLAAVAAACAVVVGAGTAIDLLIERYRTHHR